jgi:hypothetical protein
MTSAIGPKSALYRVLAPSSHRVGYPQFNAGAVIRAHAEARGVAQRIISEVEMGLLGRSPRSRQGLWSASSLPISGCAPTPGRLTDHHSRPRSLCATAQPSNGPSASYAGRHQDPDEHRAVNDSWAA